MFVPTAELLNIREYLSTSYSPDCDYVDGVGMHQVQELRTENSDTLVPLGALFES